MSQRPTRRVCSFPWIGTTKQGEAIQPEPRIVSLKATVAAASAIAATPTIVVSGHAPTAVITPNADRLWESLVETMRDLSVVFGVARGIEWLVRTLRELF